MWGTMFVRRDAIMVLFGLSVTYAQNKLKLAIERLVFLLLLQDTLVHHSNLYRYI